MLRAQIWSMLVVMDQTELQIATDHVSFGMAVTIRGPAVRLLLCNGLRVELEPLVLSVRFLVHARCTNGRVRSSLTLRSRVLLLELLKHLDRGALGGLLLAASRLIQSRLVVIVEVGLRASENVVCLRKAVVQLVSE